MPSFVNRGRDVALLIEKEGELGMRKAIYKLAEDNEMLRQELADLVQAVGAVIKLTRSLTGATAAVQLSMEKFERKHHPDNEANPDQKWSS